MCIVYIIFFSLKKKKNGSKNISKAFYDFTFVIIEKGKKYSTRKEHNNISPLAECDCLNVFSRRIVAFSIYTFVLNFN